MFVKSQICGNAVFSTYSWVKVIELTTDDFLIAQITASVIYNVIYLLFDAFLTKEGFRVGSQFIWYLILGGTLSENY